MTGRASLTAVVLVLLATLALWLRAAGQGDAVFVGDQVLFSGMDAWYHMRLSEHLLHNFPHALAFDPYSFFPRGQHVPVAPFFDLLLVSVVKGIGLGAPSQRTLEVVGAWFPAVLGALVTVPTFLLGRALADTFAGLIAAAVAAVLPGEFLLRSTIGFTDHHIAEVLFSTCTILLLVLALKRPGGSLLRAGLAAVMLGVYLLSWYGGVLLVFTLFLYFLVQQVLDHLQGRSTPRLGAIGFLLFLVPLLMILPFLGRGIFKGSHVVALTVGMLAVPAAGLVSRRMAGLELRRFWFPVALAGAALGGLALLFLINRRLLGAMLVQFLAVAPGGGTPGGESVPLLVSADGFSLAAAWDNFTTGFFVAVIATVVLARKVLRNAAPHATLGLVWCLVMLAVTLSQRRYAYYFAVNVAVLTGYLAWRLVRRNPGARRWITVGAATLALVFVPSLSRSLDSERYPVPDDDWYESLVWMRSNTPEPFGNAEFYTAPYLPPPSRTAYDYPESAYGVLSWWDYGHWITRIARRVPNANPFGSGTGPAAKFFTTPDEDRAAAMLDRLGSRYVMIDYRMATTKFPAIPPLAGADPADFFETYFRDDGRGGLEPVLLLYPDYYRSMVARLYNFGGDEVVPHDATLIVAYANRVGDDGRPYKEITSLQRFESYEAALADLETGASGRRIVGDNAFLSPVPLPGLAHFQRVHRSDTVAARVDGVPIALVETFEYIP